MDNRVLIVEDEPKLREVLCDYFTSKGDRPIPAADGLQALELIGQEDIDAILLDIMMPGLDGFAVCRAVRRKKDTPIIFLTALSDEEDKLYGYELGADDYVTKPYSLAVIHSYTDGLQEHIAEEKREKYLEVILSETERMDDMVLEMLDLSRLEAGRVKLARDEFSLLTLCRGVFDKLELALQAKELRITYNCEARNTRQGVAFSFRI